MNEKTKLNKILMKKRKIKTMIDKQFGYNTYIRDFFNNKEKFRARD